MVHFFSSLLGAFLVAGMLSCSEVPRYVLLYEQSGGLGGVREYRLQIDSNRWCSVELLQSTDTVRRFLRRLDAHTYERLWRMLSAAELWLPDTAHQDEPLRADAPYRELRLRTGGQEKSVIVRHAPSDALQPLLVALDSLAEGMLSSPTVSPRQSPR